MKWTEEAIRAEAAKYRSKSEFSRGNESAYTTVNNRFKGLIHELFPNELPRLSWTEEAVRAEAAKYSSREEFRLGNSRAYGAARNFPGLFDELFGKAFRWTEEAIRAEAAKYQSKREFYNCNYGAYQAATKRGMLDELFGKSFRWTEEAIRAEAAKYSSRVEFYRGNASAYAAATKRGMLDELFDRKTRKPWTEEELRVEAAKYSSKADFRRAANGAYVTASDKFPGLLDELFDNLIKPCGYWTEETIRPEAAKYRGRGEFQDNNISAYQAARRISGLLDDLFGTARKKQDPHKWTEEAIRPEAAKYQSKKDFERGSSGAYHAARKTGLIDELFDNQPKYTDGDAIYIWRVEGVTFKKRPVFKVGITSARLGFHRIHNCAKTNKVKATDIHLFKLENAEKVEAGMHKMLTVVPDCGFTDGKTEFRSCTEATIKTVIEFVSNYGERMAA